MSEIIRKKVHVWKEGSFNIFHRSMVARETILLGNQYVQYVSVALGVTPKYTIAEWVHGKPLGENRKILKC